MTGDLRSTSRREVLVALQRYLADALDACEPREVAPLAKQLAACVAELEALPGGGEASRVNEIAAARLKRQQDAARRAGETS